MLSVGGTARLRESSAGHSRMPETARPGARLRRRQESWCGGRGLWSCAEKRSVEVSEGSSHGERLRLGVLGGRREQNRREIATCILCGRAMSLRHPRARAGIRTIHSEQGE
eukprot:scaffold49245_cov28-Tisochrysis_lutea.AAC.4